MRHERLPWITATFLLASLAAPFTGLAQEQAQEHHKKHRHYTLVDIGTFGGPHSQVNFNSRVINSRGTVAGGASTSIPDPICTFDAPYCFYFHALTWKNGVETDLGTLPGGNNSFTSAVNSHGWAAGDSENGIIDPVFGPEVVATSGKRLARSSTWERSGALSAWRATSTIGPGRRRILQRDPGPISGDVGTQLRAFLWQHGQMQDLGTLGGTDASANFVNERGQVAGISYTSSVPNPENGIPTIDPFLWENGHMTDLGSLGGINSCGHRPEPARAGRRQLRRDERWIDQPCVPVGPGIVRRPRHAGRNLRKRKLDR